MKPKEQPSRLLYETMEYHVRRPDINFRGLARVVAAYWSGKPLLRHESRSRPIFTSANAAIWWWNANRKLDYVARPILK